MTDFTDWNRDPSQAKPGFEYIVLLENSSVRCMRKGYEGTWGSLETGKASAYKVVAFAECLNRSV